MKRMRLIWIGCLATLSQFIYAVAPPLVVAVDNFSPPFVMRGANNQFYGFDIAMVGAVCRDMQRTCVYQPMSFDNLLNAVISKKADLAVGAIIITTERAALVNFSMPYLVSKFMFIGNHKNDSFALSVLDNQNIGAQLGTVYPQVLNSLGVVNPNIKLYNQPEAMVAALQSGEINYALMDASAAMYWQSQSSDTLALLGTPMAYGFGFGIAVNKERVPLLDSVNKALLFYQNSPQFNKDYNDYLSYF